MCVIIDLVMKVKKFIKIIICMSLMFILCSCGNEEVELNYTTKKVGDETVYTIKTKKYVVSDEATNLVMINVKDYGIMVAELYPDKAPITVENFKNLISSNFYSGLIFHRVINGFVIQTGDPNGNGTGGSEETIKGEFEANGVKNDISHEEGYFQWQDVEVIQKQKKHLTQHQVNFILYKMTLHI